MEQKEKQMESKTLPAMQRKDFLKGGEHDYLCDSTLKEQFDFPGSPHTRRWISI